MQRDDFLSAAMECERTLYRVAKTLLRSDADCADAVQEALLKGLKNAPLLRNKASVRSWMTKIVINTCKDMIRKNVRQQTVELTDMYSIQDGNMARFELYDAVYSLDEKLRVPLILHCLEGFTVSEVSSMLKIPEGTLKRRIWQARKELREMLREEAI